MEFSFDHHKHAAVQQEQSELLLLNEGCLPVVKLWSRLLMDRISVSVTVLSRRFEQCLAWLAQNRSLEGAPQFTRAFTVSVSKLLDRINASTIQNQMHHFSSVRSCCVMSQ